MDVPKPGRKPFRVVGREAELEVLSRFLDSGSASCLVFSGEPGIGKTTLWQAALEIASRKGFHVLSTRASRGEVGLLFAALADLVEGIDADALAQVPAPQIHAVEVALRRVPPDEAPPEPFAISAGFLAAVRALVVVGRPIIAVDDIRWLDPSSAECLLFLARRLGGGEVRFLLSRRRGEASELERTLEPFGVEIVDVEAMSVGAISRMLTESLDLVLPRRVLRQVYEASHGNPLFALELGRTIRETGLPEAAADVPVPMLVDEAVGARVRALPDPLRQALLAVSLNARLTRAELASIVDPLVVEDAFDDGLLVIDRGRVRPSHPMLSATAKRETPGAERRALHLALADVITDPISTARHRALAAMRPDPQAAAAVTAAVRLAFDRGAMCEATELAAHALRLTPSGAVEETDRVFELARCHLGLMDLPAAEKLLQARLHHLPPGAPRVVAHLLLADTASDPEIQARELDLAIADAGDDDHLRAVAFSRKAIWLTSAAVERISEARELARMARSHAARVDADNRSPLGLGDLTLSTVASAWADLMSGVPIRHLSHEATDPATRGDVFVSTLDRPIGIQRAFRGDVGAAKEMIGPFVDLADNWGKPGSRIAGCRQLCEFALRAGDIHDAGQMLDDLEQWNFVPAFRTAFARLSALAASIAGRPEEARSWAAGVLDPATAPLVHRWDCLEATRALGIAALFERDFPSAVKHLRFVWDHCRREGVDDPGAFPVAGDLVEALVESGSIDRASQVARLLARLSNEQDHPWGLATTRRAHALISLAGGYSADAGSALQAAAADYGHLGLEFERARCLVYLGRLQRRAKKRAEARETIEAAADVFERLGCDGWCAAARSELTRLGGRRPGDESELTPSEQRVVDLAVGGLSNKQIAIELFVSVHTVEVHLSHAYAKLGVSSRNQLARLHSQA